MAQHRVLSDFLSLFLALFGLAACEQSVVIADILVQDRGTTPSGAGGEPPNVDETTGGAGGAPVVAEPTAPRFSAPQLVAELSDPNFKDQDPTLTADLLEIFFFSERSGEPEIWTSTRASRDSAWNAPTQVLELSAPELDINPAVSGDGLRLWFHSQREPSGIWYSERSSRSDTWGAPVRLDVFGGEIAPGPSADELRMGLSVFAEGDQRDIYEATRLSTTDPWSVPLPILGLNTELDESTPFLIGDGSEMLFSSARSGWGDLYWARRPTLDGPVLEPEPLSELNDPEVLDSHPYLSVDGTRIFFGSARSGNTDIYEAVLLAP